MLIPLFSPIYSLSPPENTGMLGMLTAKAALVKERRTSVLEKEKGMFRDAKRDVEELEKT
jgi:hypothetical protein